MSLQNKLGPQPFLQGNGQAVGHLQFTFRSHVQSSDLIARLGHLWDTALIGDDDPTTEGVYGKTQPPEFGAPSGSIVVGFRPEW